MKFGAANIKLVYYIMIYESIRLIIFLYKKGQENP